MKSCICTTSPAVMVNGGPSSFFKAARRLRQGDPLSPLLFIIVMEAFSKLLERDVELNLFKRITVGRGDSRVEISYLFFADDVLIFCQPEEITLFYRRCVLLYFQLVSVLKINMKKFKLVRIGDKRDKIAWLGSWSVERLFCLLNTSIFPSELNLKRGELRTQLDSCLR